MKRNIFHTMISSFIYLRITHCIEEFELNISKLKGGNAWETLEKTALYVSNSHFLCSHLVSLRLSPRVSALFGAGRYCIARFRFEHADVRPKNLSAEVKAWSVDGGTYRKKTTSQSSTGRRDGYNINSYSAQPDFFSPLRRIHFARPNNNVRKIMQSRHPHYYEPNGDENSASIRYEILVRAWPGWLPICEYRTQ